MPRVDKVREFRKQVNEEADSYDETSAQESGSGKSSDVPVKEQKPMIDFSLYLREPKYTLEDVVLPESTKHQVDMALAEIRHQDLIYNVWGMGEKHKLDKALSVNFSGPPGTGKTLTAEALAHAMGMKILAVPYQQIESKFVGDTPKNIAGVFEFAARENALLFFDEADSFLGKRLESVTQSTDTAVNLTRSVMIVQLSAYEGVVVFATNLIRNYDPAFISRIRRKVQFDLPDENARIKIWKAQIPDKLPLDESVDFTQLGSQSDDISGRDIKNAVFQAVVAAAGEEKPESEKSVTQHHFVQAMTQIIEANKAASEPKYTLTPAEKEVKLPSETYEDLAN